ncbi:MLN64 N-terminal domain like protein [Myotis davidii]|uniref:MLN64 N-terminal domain like protein n=1 Tax=Myotis davidii TaxID=225400 RepID=L5LBZ6_MYODS|nr:MLN64 N-terminal domain like protein [Myotis davidii]
MNSLPADMENALTGSQSSRASLRDVHSINPAQLMARIESYEGREKKGISDVNGGIENTLEKEVVQYDFYSSYFDIFLFSQGAFGYVLPIISFILAWIETWFLDFKVLPQESEEENRLLIVQDASERAALIPGGLSDGQFYSPPESEAVSSLQLCSFAAIVMVCPAVYEPSCPSDQVLGGEGIGAASGKNTTAVPRILQFFKHRHFSDCCVPLAIFRVLKWLVLSI